MGLNGAMQIAVSGLTSFSSAMSIVSDNVANANTTGFKSSAVRFGDLVSSYYSTQSGDTDREGAGSTLTGIATDFSQGPLQRTDTWSDMAINGNGFFNIQAPNGGTLYTRDGGFHMDRNGFLVTLQGYQVVGDDGNPVLVEDLASYTPPYVPQYTNYNVDAGGQIWGTPVAGGDPVALGRPLRVTTFPNQDGLLRWGSNYYTRGPETGTAVDGVANSGPRGAILDLNIEGSNVDLATEMVNMVIYQADYNANSKAILTANQMLDTVVNLIR